eukprot:1139050-Pelagomonas_calceolata.AAC.1
MLNEKDLLRRHRKQSLHQGEDSHVTVSFLYLKGRRIHGGEAIDVRSIYAACVFDSCLAVQGNYKAGGYR